MDQDRWSQITGSFAVERGEPENGHMSIFSGGKNHDEQRDSPKEAGSGEDSKESMNKILRDVAENSHNLSDENSKIISTLKAIIKEKAEKIRYQQDIIASFRKKAELSKENFNTKDASTQVDHGDLRDSTILYPGFAAVKSSEMATNPTTSQEGCNKPSELEDMRSKVEGLEKRLDDVLLAFIQNQPTKFSVDNVSNTCGTILNVGKNPAVFRPWNKPPMLRPKPTSGSVLREAYCRNRNNCSNKDSSPGKRESGLRKSMTSFGHNAYTAEFQTGMDYFPDEIEQRLQFLESLVVQLKMKFMRIIALHQKGK